MAATLGIIWTGMELKSCQNRLSDLECTQGTFQSYTLTTLYVIHPSLIMSHAGARVVRRVRLDKKALGLPRFMGEPQVKLLCASNLWS